MRKSVSLALIALSLMMGCATTPQKQDPIPPYKESVSSKVYHQNWMECEEMLTQCVNLCEGI